MVKQTPQKERLLHPREKRHGTFIPLARPGTSIAPVIRPYKKGDRRGDMITPLRGNYFISGIVVIVPAMIFVTEKFLLHPAGGGFLFFLLHPTERVGPNCSLGNNPISQKTKRVDPNCSQGDLSNLQKTKEVVPIVPWGTCQISKNQRGGPNCSLGHLSNQVGLSVPCGTIPISKNQKCGSQVFPGGQSQSPKTKRVGPTCSLGPFMF